MPPCPDVEKKALVYYMDAVKRFINISNNKFMVSVNEQQQAGSAAKAIEVNWETAYELQAK